MEMSPQDPRRAETGVAETGVHEDTDDARPEGDETHVPGSETETAGNVQELTGQQEAPQSEEPTSAAVDEPVEEDIYMADADAETLSDSDDSGIWDLSESHFGDTESNGEFSQSGEQSPLVFSDAEDEDSNPPGDDEETLVDEDPGTDSDSNPDSPIRRGHHQSDTILYGHITDDEDDNGPFVNGFQRGNEPSPTTDGSQQGDVDYDDVAGGENTYQPSVNGVRRIGALPTIPAGGSDDSDATQDENGRHHPVNGANGVRGQIGRLFAPNGYIYSDSSDDERDNQPLGNGTLGDGEPSVAGNSGTRANGAAAASHTEPRSQQETSGEANREASDREQNYINQPAGNDGLGAQPAEAPIEGEEVLYGQRNQDAFAEFEQSLSNNITGAVTQPDIYLDPAVGGLYTAWRFAREPYSCGLPTSSTFRPSSRANSFYNDPVDWDDDEERIRRTARNTLASYMRQFAMADHGFPDKENVAPARRSSPLPPGQSSQHEELQSPSRYRQESRIEHQHYSFGVLRPVPAYPMPSQNISSHAPVTTAHIWYRHVATDIESIPEQTIAVGDVVRPIDDLHMEFDDMGL